MNREEILREACEAIVRACSGCGGKGYIDGTDYGHAHAVVTSACAKRRARFPSHGAIGADARFGGEVLNREEKVEKLAEKMAWAIAGNWGEQGKVDPGDVEDAKPYAEALVAAEFPRERVPQSQWQGYPHRRGCSGNAASPCPRTRGKASRSASTTPPDREMPVKTLLKRAMGLVPLGAEDPASPRPESLIPAESKVSPEKKENER